MPITLIIDFKFKDFVPENDKLIFEAKRMMQFLEKTLQLEPKQKTLVLPTSPKMPRFDFEALKVKNDLNSDFQENIRKMTRLRVANALRTRMASQHNISTCNKKSE